MQLHHLGIGPDEAHLFQRLANAVIYPEASLRPASDQLSAQHAGSFPRLWAWEFPAILPIILALIDNEEDVEIDPAIVARA